MSSYDMHRIRDVIRTVPFWRDPEYCRFSDADHQHIQAQNVFVVNLPGDPVCQNDADLVLEVFGRIHQNAESDVLYTILRGGELNLFGGGERCAVVPQPEQHILTQMCDTDFHAVMGGCKAVSKNVGGHFLHGQT